MICVDCANGSHSKCANKYRQVTDEELNVLHGSASAVHSYHRGTLVLRDVDLDQEEMPSKWCDCMHRTLHTATKSIHALHGEYKDFTYDHVSEETFYLGAKVLM